MALLNLVLMVAVAEAMLSSSSSTYQEWAKFARYQPQLSLFCGLATREPAFSALLQAMDLAAQSVAFRLPGSVARFLAFRFQVSLVPRKYGFFLALSWRC